MKKFLSILMACLILSFSFAGASFASEQETATVTVVEDTYTRMGNKAGLNFNGEYVGIASGLTAYLKFDISTLRTDMNGKDAKYTLQFTTTADNTNGTGSLIYIYGITGIEWKEDELTYNSANSTGLDTDITNKIGEISVVGKSATFTVDVTDYIKTVPTDTNIITIKLQNKETTGTVLLASKDTDPAVPATLTAERTYTDDYTGGINPKMYMNGKIATELRAGVATARVAFVGNDVTDAPKGTLILALYNGNALEDIESTSLDFSDEFVNDMSVSLDVPSGEGYSVKAFLLSGFDTLVPLTECEELR